MIPYIVRAAVFAISWFALPSNSDASSLHVDIDWTNVLIESKTTATLQSVANPPLLLNSSTRDNALNSLKSVAANYVLYVLWFPYPVFQSRKSNYLSRMRPIAPQAGTSPTQIKCYWTSWQILQMYLRSSISVRHLTGCG